MNKTIINPDLEIHPKTRGWAGKKYGMPYLPDAFLPTIVDHFEVSGVKHRDWQIVIKQWINKSGPSGCYYNPADWEKKRQKAKMLGGEITTRKPTYSPVPQKPRNVPLAREYLSAAVEKLKG